MRDHLIPVGNGLVVPPQAGVGHRGLRVGPPVARVEPGGPFERAHRLLPPAGLAQVEAEAEIQVGGVRPAGQGLLHLTDRVRHLAAEQPVRGECLVRLRHPGLKAQRGFSLEPRVVAARARRVGSAEHEM